MILLPLLAADLMRSPQGRRPIVVLPLAVSAVLLVALTASFAAWWLPVVATVLLGGFWLIHLLPEGYSLRRSCRRRVFPWSASPPRTVR